MISGDSLSNLNSESQLQVTVDEGEEEVEGLFGDVEWGQVRVEELVAGWAASLAQIERDNVAALTEVAERSQTLLPSLQTAIVELGKVEGVLGEYSSRLRQMGADLQQIGELNRGLGQQTRNQQVLLSELDSLLAPLQLSPQVEADLAANLSLDSPGHLRRLEEAARQLQAAATHRYGHGLGRLRGVEGRQRLLAERLEAFQAQVSGYLQGRLREASLTARTQTPPAALATLLELLQAYAALMQPAGEALLREALERAVREGPGEAYREWLEGLRGRLLRRPADDHLFRSQPPLGNLVGSQQQRAWALVKLGEEPPELKAGEGLLAGQVQTL